MRFELPDGMEGEHCVHPSEFGVISPLKRSSKGSQDSSGSWGSGISGEKSEGSNASSPSSPKRKKQFFKSCTATRDLDTIEIHPTSGRIIKVLTNCLNSTWLDLFSGVVDASVMFTWVDFVHGRIGCSDSRHLPAPQSRLLEELLIALRLSWQIWF